MVPTCNACFFNLATAATTNPLICFLFLNGIVCLSEALITELNRLENFGKSDLSKNTSAFPKHLLHAYEMRSRGELSCTRVRLFS